MKKAGRFWRAADWLSKVVVFVDIGRRLLQRVTHFVPAGVAGGKFVAFQKEDLVRSAMIFMICEVDSRARHRATGKAHLLAHMPARKISLPRSAAISLSQICKLRPLSGRNGNRERAESARLRICGPSSASLFVDDRRANLVD